VTKNAPSNKPYSSRLQVKKTFACQKVQVTFSCYNQIEGLKRPEEGEKKVELSVICESFSLVGEVTSLNPFGNGHINDTFRVDTITPAGIHYAYVVQRINKRVFTKPWQVMENMVSVTSHMAGKVKEAGGDVSREVLTLVPARNGANFVVDEEGNYWRACHLIPGAVTYETGDNPKVMYEAGRAFGRFLAQLDDFPVTKLYETIPGFHNTPRRLKQFEQVVRADPVQHADDLAEEIRFLLERSKDCEGAVIGLSSGNLRLRVTHNDTKINNVLMDEHTGKSLCVIDLDTVMPGCVLYDFGDLVRSAAALTEEDEPHSERAGISVEGFEQLARGFLAEANAILSGEEVSQLVYGAWLITYEQALRFLTDYLDGDRYYKIKHLQHNLDRARVQIGMVKSIEDHWDELQTIIHTYRQGVKE
jgi:aminoglycoside phosphotransferase (APT) family kinase protein